MELNQNDLKGLFEIYCSYEERVSKVQEQAEASEKQLYEAQQAALADQERLVYEQRCLDDIRALLSAAFAGKVEKTGEGSYRKIS